MRVVSFKLLFRVDILILLIVALFPLELLLWGGACDVSHVHAVAEVLVRVLLGFATFDVGDVHAVSDKFGRLWQFNFILRQNIIRSQRIRVFPFCLELQMLWLGSFDVSVGECRIILSHANMELS